jgi:exodeoxyribonuclease V gamma subunit
MRSVPYRVVCLLGMENDRFPRSGRNDGDDLLADDERIGDPDRSAEDRQLILDALMAAGDDLLITYTGRDPLTNAAYPPAVPVAELEETIAAMIGAEAAALVVTEHPLQPFSPKVFTDNELGTNGPWGFDPIQHAGAIALIEKERRDTGDDALVLEPIAVESPSLDQIIAYLTAPSATFLRRSLAVFIPSMDDAEDDELPTGLNGLERWSVADRLLRGIAAGYGEERLVAHERATDSVPAGELAAEPLADAVGLARRLERVAEEQGCVAGSFAPIAGTVTLHGHEIGGSVLADPGFALVCDVGPSRAKPRRRISLYARVVFLTALDPSRPWRGVLIGKGDRAGTVDVVTIGPLGGDAVERAREAQRRLADLVGLYFEGMATPLPLFVESSYAWQSSPPNDRRYRTAGVWEPDWKGDGGEREEPAHRMLFDELDSVADLAASDFPDYAERLWAPILDVGSEATL